MKKGLKRPVRIRKKWRINPKTRVEKDGRLYNRRKIKKAIREVYEETAEGK